MHERYQVFTTTGLKITGEIWDYIAETAYTLEEKFGYLGWTEAVKNMDFNTFNDVFAPAFVIRIEPLME